MECGDPTKWNCDFIPTDCDVYVIGLQEAGGENIAEVPASPRPQKKKDGTEETLYNMIESYLLQQCGTTTLALATLALCCCCRGRCCCRRRCRRRCCLSPAQSALCVLTVLCVCVLWSQAARVYATPTQTSPTACSCLHGAPAAATNP